MQFAAFGRSFALAGVAFLLVSATLADDTAATPAPGSTPQASSAWDSYTSDFVEWYFSVNPSLAVIAGRHEYDGQLPDWSPAAIQSVVNRLHVERNRVQRFKSDQLDAHQRFEREVLAAEIDRELFVLETMRGPFRNPAYYGDSLDPDPYLSRDYAPLEQRMKAFIAYEKALPKAIEQIRANLKTPMPRTFVGLGHVQFGGYVSFFRDEIPPMFQSVQDPALQDALRDANAKAIEAVQAMDAWFHDQEASANDAFAMGVQRFEEMLWATDRLRVPVVTLEKIGEADLERNERALADACAVYAPGKSIDECVAKFRSDKASGPPVETARAQLDSLKAFVQSHDIVSIPAPEQALVHEAPAYQRWNMAYISIPGPYEKNIPATYYIAPPDPNWTKQEQDAYIPAKDDLLFTSVHEVWPGHYLQFLHGNRSWSRVGRVFQNYEFAEGWAHYGEELMWEEGLGAGDAEAHIGQLTNALERNVRLLCAIGLHTGNMSVAQSEAMFRERAHMDPADSRQQAARGTFDPQYGDYTLGKLMIRKLREEWTAGRGGRAAWKSFHDEFLSYGTAPIPLVRRALLGDDSGPPL